MPRLRLLALCAGLAAALLLVWALALWGAQNRMETGTGGALFAFLLGGVLACLLVFGLWRLLDGAAAVPLARLAAALRTRADGMQSVIDPGLAPALGDLGPAAAALAARLDKAEIRGAEAAARATTSFRTEVGRLAALLGDLPQAVVLLGPEDRILLYNAAAAEALGRVAPPRLGGRIGDWLDPRAVQAARGKLARTGFDVAFAASGAGDGPAFELTLRHVDAATRLLLIATPPRRDTPAPGPLVHDFALLSDVPPLPFVVVEIATSGPLPHRDTLTALSARRLLLGRAVPGEALDLRLAPASVPDALRRLHGLCREAVIVGHNAPLLRAFLLYHSQGLAWDHPLLDTGALGRRLFPEEPDTTRPALLARLGLELPADAAPAARADVMAKAVLRMLPHLGEDRDTLLAEIGALSQV